MKKTGLVGWLDRNFYPGVESHWDDTMFRQHVLRALKATDRLLDIGSGAGILPQMNFRGHAAEIHGVDLDSRVTSNPHLDFGYVTDASQIPLGDGMFDVAVADNVIEHLDDPDAVFVEIHRLLRPGGVFLFKTPNVWHYMPLIARMTPTGFHKFYNRIRGRDVEDTFPTRYRANRKAAIFNLARRTGFAVEYVEQIESRPEYLRISSLTYVAGIIYERLVNIAPVFGMFRILLIARLHKLDGV